MGAYFLGQILAIVFCTWLFWSCIDCICETFRGINNYFKRKRLERLLEIYWNHFQDMERGMGKNEYVDDLVSKIQQIEEELFILRN